MREVPRLARKRITRKRRKMNLCAGGERLSMSDAQREREIRALRERYARGDLTSEELDEKLDALFAGRPSSELAEPDAVERHLGAGERVEWVGRPDPAKHFTRGDVFLVPFSILWCGFAVFWEATAISSGGGVFFALWGIPFVALGLYFVFGRFVAKASRARRTTYAVTNRRVLTIVRGRRGESVEAMYLGSIPSISTSAVSNGRGSVEFGSSSQAGWYANTGLELLGRGRSAGGGIGFYDLEDADGVAGLVARLRDPRCRGSAPPPALPGRPA